ncbi:hypothetical protein [Armatimonas sp.]|uniref:hypothetical protein n=1 Tax=Armatimonas sp. TaxID=1872638 RepID=UPI0037528F4B
MQTPPSLTFPRVQADNLEGKKLSFPQDFAGELNLVFVAFQRNQQRDIDTWVPLAKELMKAHPKLRLYEFPVIGKMIGLMRDFVNNGMRRGIPDPATRAITITIYSDKGAFMRPLGLKDQKKIYAFIVTPKGDVLWRTEGPRTESGEKSLREFLDKVK